MSKGKVWATPLLEQRAKAYDLTPITFQPTDNQVVVWRLPSITTTAAGLHIPVEARAPHCKALLLAMGPRAMDVLYSNGYQEGHIVMVALWSGHEFHDNSAGAFSDQEIMIVKDRDIQGSDDLADEIRSGRAKYIKGADGRHVLERKLLSTGKKEKLLALAANNDNPHEAKLARKLASKIKD